LKREALILPVRKETSRTPPRAALIVLVLAPQLACSRPGEDASSAKTVAPSSNPGAPANAAAFVNLGQLEAEIAKFRGRGLLLNVWATWCAPCVAELPELIETRRAFQGRGGEVLLLSYDLMIPGVTRDGVAKTVEAFVSKRHIDAPGLIYDAEDYDAIDARFELSGGVPVTLAFDRNGKIVDRQAGRADKARFAEMMERALAP
jgi:thiol-disulfide isomerase/thioredoxin